MPILVFQFEPTICASTTVYNFTIYFLPTTPEFQVPHRVYSIRNLLYLATSTLRAVA